MERFDESLVVMKRLFNQEQDQQQSQWQSADKDGRAAAGWSKEEAIQSEGKGSKVVSGQQPTGAHKGKNHHHIRRRRRWRRLGHHETSKSKNSLHGQGSSNSGQTTQEAHDLQPQQQQQQKSKSAPAAKTQSLPPEPSPSHRISSSSSSTNPIELIDLTYRPMLHHDPSYIEPPEITDQFRARLTRCLAPDIEFYDRLVRYYELKFLAPVGGVDKLTGWTLGEEVKEFQRLNGLLEVVLSKGCEPLPGSGSGGSSDSVSSSALTSASTKQLAFSSACQLYKGDHLILGQLAKTGGYANKVLF